MTIPDEVMRIVGMVSEPLIYRVEKGAIERFADAIDDPNPLYRDVEYATKSRYGGLLAPLGFFGWPVKGRRMGEGLHHLEVIAKHMGLSQTLDGGGEYEYVLPVRAGDILICYAKLSEIVERHGKDGRQMVFVTTETRYLNQNGDLVAIARQVVIVR